MSETAAAMKGLILAGGKATRLRPFTYTGAKQLVPVANKPVLFYAVEQLVEAGISEIGVVVGDTAEEVMGALGDGSRFGARFTYLRQDAPRGLAHGVKIARDFLGETPFIMFLGDNFFRGGIVPWVERFTREQPGAQVHLVRVPDPTQVGVAVLTPDGRLARVIEKPKEPPSNLALTGVYFFTPAVHEAVANLKPSARGELEITDAIQALVDQGLRVDAYPVEDYWIDTGKFGDMLDANRTVLETIHPEILGEVDAASRLTGRVVVQAGARIVNSVIEGPAIIGEHTVIERAYIGPFTSVYHDCRIEDSELSGSMVLERTLISCVPHRIEGSLIGRDVKLTGGNTRPRAYRLILGDHSEARLP